jgi:DNA-binding response OmpR family regulator
VKRVLLFDDSELTLRVARGALEASGFEVLAVHESNDLAAAARQRPDLILLDVQMSELYGDDLVDFLREEWGVRAPIHLFSGMDERELAERARQAGADGWLSKKRGVDALVDRVTELLGGR